MNKATILSHAPNRRAFASLLLSAPCLVLPSIGSANPTDSNYPVRPIKVIVPFAAGTATDTIARMAAQHLSDRLKQPVIVENKAGANGAIGADTVAKAKPDGYTLVFTTNTTLSR